MTLSQTAGLTKRIIIFSIIALVLGITSFIGYQIWHTYYLAHLPPVEEKPDTKFGVLPFPTFPKTSVSSSNFSYSLDTSTGTLPKMGKDPGFDKIIKVYFVTKSYATFLSSDKSQTLAEKFGINTQPEILSETIYKFTDQNKILNVDLDTGNFAYTKEATPPAQQSLDSDNKLVSDFENILNTLGILKDDLKKGRTKVMLLKAEGKNLVSTTLQSEAQLAQISLWPQTLDQKSIFTADFNKSLVNAVIFNSASDLSNYFSLNFTYWPIETTTFATYPTKSAENAFDDLKSGKGVVVLEPPKPQVSITSVYLGYYLSQNYSPYLQPIFVFEGPSFVAYVPAIKDQYQHPATQNSNTSSQ